MKLFLDFFPVVLFFIVFKFFDVFTATAVAIGATVLQIIWLRVKFGRVEMMQWISLGLISVFGGATLLLHDETFIKFKPSVLYVVMALALWVGHFGFGKNFLKTLMSEQIQVPEQVWQVLVHAWGAFFLMMAGLNLWVAYNFDTNTWVNFKLFGGMGLMFVFVVLQAIYLSSKAISPPEEQDSSHTNLDPQVSSEMKGQIANPGSSTAHEHPKGP
jgi:intracellular septation protein